MEIARIRHMSHVTKLTIDIAELSGRTVLAGAASGVAAASALLEATKDVVDQGIVFVDFRRVEVATSSFLRECLLGFREAARRGPKSLHPVAANLPQVVEEEMQSLLATMDEAFVSCRINAREVPSNARVIGRLDDKQA